MAKRKKRSELSYNKEWYERYRLALKYYNIDVKILKRPTKKSVHRLRTQWKGLTKQMKKAGYIDLPTVYQASKFIKESEARPNITSIPSEQLASEPLQYEAVKQNAEATIDDLINTVKRMGSNAGFYFKNRALDRIASSKMEAVRLLEFAKQKTDPVELAKVLAENEFITRAIEYEILDSDNVAEFYDYVTNELYDVISSAIQTSLERI